MNTEAPSTVAETLPSAGAGVAARAAGLLQTHQVEIWRRTDKLFMGLLAFQWLGGIALALWLTPRTWNGTSSAVHPHVWQAIVLGTAILLAPFCFGFLMPGRTITRHVIAVGQMLSSALLIHLGGGRIEMHFHVFGSLAFLTFYRDWRVLITASAIVAADHLLRGYFFPQSTYGILDPSAWRWLEHAAWVIFEDIFLITSCLQSVREMRIIAERQAQIERSYEEVEEKVRLRTRELQEAQQKLVDIARSAGKAEIASSVLHNVGNVLNSVNVSLRVATTRVQQSPVGNLGKAVRMMNQHKEDIGQFLSIDERGRQIPGYLETVADIMSEEHAALLEELNSLGKNVEHIKQIVSVQQTHAKAAGISEKLDAVSLIEDALRINMLENSASGIEIVRQFDGLPVVNTDKHIVLQIVVNLLSNAKHALLNSGKTDKRLTVRALGASLDDPCKIQIQIQDNGMGIDPANLNKIFNHGFTTKKDGHGFGLHSAANAARQIGGSLRVHSDGPGTGAVFTLELPLQQEATV